ncbi:MAG: hypothetical protein ACK4YD_08020 [Chitinophagia bacterium]
MKITILITFLLIFLTNVFANEEKDLLLKVKKERFLVDFFNRDGFLYPALGSANVFLHPNDPVYASKPQVLIKNEHSFWISIASSGRVYQYVSEDDTSYLFKRLDNSLNQNYNIGGYYFTHNEKLYCFSGYGFWKNNGTLKTFNPKDGEWDLIPMQREVIPQLFPMGNFWYDATSHQLYVPFQSKVNAGIMGDENIRGIIDTESSMLNLKKNRWEKIGKATGKAIELIRNGSYSLSTSHGLLVNQGSDVYLFDYQKNTISISKNISFNQSLLRAHQKSFLYQYKNHIYHYNIINGNSDSTMFNLQDFEMIPEPIWEKQRDTPLLIGISLSVLLFVFFLHQTGKKKEQEKAEKSIPKIRNAKIEFTDTEKSLLKLLWSKTSAGSSASVSDINYILGIKDKKIGLQKKVRSDIFNSINEKYYFLINKKEPLILSVRSEEDKRFFEFCISPEAVSIIKEYME